MTKFIELTISDEDESKIELINVAMIGRVYPSPQNRIKCMVELAYQSINDAPVFLEVESSYEELKTRLMTYE